MIVDPNSSKLIKFIIEDWQHHPEIIMTSPRCGSAFDVSRGTAHYYLNKFAEKGYLIRVRYEHNIWYMHCNHKDSFKIYSLVGVIIW